MMNQSRNIGWFVVAIGVVTTVLIIGTKSRDKVLLGLALFPYLLMPLIIMKWNKDKFAVLNLLALLSTVAFGLYAIYSATYVTPDPLASLAIPFAQIIIFIVLSLSIEVLRRRWKKKT